jgi:hypothetical protein
VRAALELDPGRPGRQMLHASSASAGALQSSHTKRWPRGRRCPLVAPSRRCACRPRVCDWGIGVELSTQKERPRDENGRPQERSS